MIRVLAALVIPALAAQLGGAQQATPPAPVPDGPDIVVNGRTPPLSGGLWQFDQSSGLMVNASGRTGAGPAPRRWQACIATGNTAEVIRQLVSTAPPRGGDEICSAMNVKVNTARVRGGQSCTLMSSEGYVSRRTLRFSATLTPEQMELSWRNRWDTGASDGVSGLNWHTQARRIGDCPMASSSPAAVQRAQVPASAPLPEPAEIPEGPQHAAPPPAARAPAPEAGGDDIVVVARKLRRLKLHYASSGRILSWCHADISSGDKRVDRIGCAILRACVREDNDTTTTALACFRRKVDEIDPG